MIFIGNLVENCNGLFEWVCIRKLCSDNLIVDLKLDQQILKLITTYGFNKVKTVIVMI